ncbi:F-type ATPase subunit b [Phaeobacter sp. CECT 5382]|uniref:F0F1 ATP synthase subunit B family protein n=1 Tax=Rhodobacterales TaxID=204455 RepID=UPI0006DAF7EF|nr:ATP synthase subunit B [Phaeobacter sp. CECT 5382]CUH89221.1 F-type ATPase subunit b [Phaeobacter sp. CECT 5382]
MSIDWITVAAQIGNFLVLIWLLKRFLYRPILDGIDARESEITQRMQAAVVAKEQAAEAEADFREQLSDLRFRQSEMTDSAQQQAEAQRDSLLAEAHQRLERERQDWAIHLDEERAKYIAKLHKAGAGALLSLTRKALCDLADQNLETQMAHHLVTQITPMAADLHRAAGSCNAALVTSHAALTPAAQEIVTTGLQQQFPGIAVEYATDAAQAPGLELRLGGAELAWTVDSYVDDLAALIEEQLAAGADLKAQPHEI